MTAAATMAFASVPQLRGILSDIVEGDAPSYTLICQSKREAELLRGRLNKLRALDRQQVIRMFAEAKTPIGETAMISSYDQLTFRVVDNDVVVERAPFNDEEIKALVIPTGSPRPEVAKDLDARQYAKGRQNVIITNKRDETPLTAEDLL